MPGFGSRPKAWSKANVPTGVRCTPSAPSPTPTSPTIAFVGPSTTFQSWPTRWNAVRVPAVASALGTPTTIHWVVCADGAGAGVGAAGAGAGVGVGAAGADTANGRLTSTAPTWAARAVSSFDTVTQAPRM